MACENRPMSDLIHENEATTFVAETAFSCLECHERRRAHVLVHERKVYWCLIPLGTERQVLVR